MNRWTKYECTCIMGPDPDETCPLHKRRGVAQLIDCPKGRPIKIWITNDTCDGRAICPGGYDDCKYKYIYRKPPAQGSML